MPRPAVHTAAVTCDVDSFIAGLGEGWQRAACGQLLGDIRAAAPFGEHLKWRHPYFELDNAAVLKWYCAKEWINVYFFRGRELPDPHRLFQPSENRSRSVVWVTLTVSIVERRIPGPVAGSCGARPRLTAHWH